MVADNNYFVNSIDRILQSAVSETVHYTPAVKKATLKVTNAKGKKAVLSIGDNSGCAAQYEIYRATTAKGTYKKIKTLTAKKGGTVTYTDKKCSKNKTYYYKIVTVIKSASGMVVKSGKTAAKSVKIKK